MKQGKRPEHPAGRRPEKRPDKKDEVVCLCNEIRKSVIEDAIRNGADTLNKIFDSTTAGVGPCGGSCRRKLQPMLEHYLATGTFPEVIKEDRRGKK